MARVQLFLLWFLEMVAAAVFVLGQSSPGDSMFPNSSLSNGQTLISAGGVFQLGFFTPVNDSAKGYLGIWYYNLPPGESKVVWVANRDRSLEISTASLNLTSDGNLIIFDGDAILWSTGTSTELNSVRLQLLDSGNLGLTAGDSIRTLWQSFDHLSDTLLPGMKFGFDLRTNTSWQLVSWRSSTDPSPGVYVMKMETHGVPQIITWNGSVKILRSGPSNSQVFIGFPSITNSTLAKKVNFTFVSNQNETYYLTGYEDRSLLSRAVVSTEGSYVRWNWDNEEWRLFWSFPADDCDNYNQCGRGSICSRGYSAISCSCLRGFVPAENGSGTDCVRERPLNCSSNQVWKVQNVKLPDAENATARGEMSLDECRRVCFGDCSCQAYTVMDGPNGCLTWSGDLSDIRSYTDGGHDLYLRLAESSSSSKKKRVLAIATPLILGFLLLCCLVVVVRRRNRAPKQGTETHIQSSAKGTQLLLQPPRTEKGDLENHSGRSNSMPDDDVSEPTTMMIDSEHSGTYNNGVGSITTLGVLVSYDLCTIKAATNDFSDENKLGEGGFGVVYKGELQDGQKIAVKKLSRYSSQGSKEFENELSLIAQLQHRNLVRVLGFCVEEDKRLIVLEYMENKSLDAFIFDKTKSGLLNWERRLKIINGIARGLLYLHQDSLLRVIHRDLKPSNILLDKEMTPKISDFGIARIFEGDETHENATRRPIGTFGYMAPEYIVDGIFSFKSDVFSFGVIVLEILSGKRNKVFDHTDTNLNLLGHAYKLWKEGKTLEILDGTLDPSYPIAEILRCIRMGLLCVQYDSEDRPTMAEVVMMLASEEQLLTPLKQPAITTTSNSEGGFTTKEMSLTITSR